MTYLLAVAAALGAGAATVVAAGAFPGAARRGSGVPVEFPIVLAAIGGLLSRAALTGNLVPDVALGVGTAAVAAWAGARAPHRVLAVFAVLVAVFLNASAWAAAGAGIAIAVVLVRSRVPPLKATAGGLLGIGILASIGSSGPGVGEVLGLIAVVVLAALAARRRSETARRNFALAASAGLLLIVASAVGFLVFAIPAARDLQRAVDLSEDATEVLTTARGEEAASSLALAANAFAQARQRLNRWPARVVDAVPVAAQNAAALRALAGAGEDVAAAAAAATTGPADLRLDAGAVDLRAVDEAALGIRDAREASRNAIRSLRATRSRSLLSPVAAVSSELHLRLTGAAPTLEVLERTLEQLPAMLGGGRPRRYLLALQTPAELRASGGIIGAFGVLEADEGRLVLTRTGTTDSHLNPAGDPASRSVIGADDFLGRYGRFSPLQIWQNVTMTPDWPTVGHIASQLFPQSGGQPIDGVIGLDPYALSAILAATGPIDVPPWPVPITAENAPRVLLHEQYSFFPNPERREFVGDVTVAAVAQLTSGQTSLRALASGLAAAARQRSVQIWSANDDEQALLRDVNAAGAFPRPDRSMDLISVVNQNSSGNKIDWFLHRQTSYDLTFDPVLGRVDGRLKVELHNDAPEGGLPNYVIGAPFGGRATRTAPGENRTWVSIYTPLDLKAARLDGRTLDMEQADELGHRVYSAFLLIPPGGTITLDLELGGLVDPSDSSYNLRLRSQVLPNPEKFSVTTRFTPGWEPQGSNREEFELVGERTVSFGFKASDD